MKKASFILVIILILHADAIPVSYKEHNRIIRKAIAAHRTLERDRNWKVDRKSVV